MRFSSKLLIAAVLATTASPALAGPFIIDGTDADDHGSVSGGANQDGWFYIQRGLENIAAGSSLTKTQKVIAILGSDPGTTASQAAISAVTLSTILSGAGWTTQIVNGAANLTNFFNGTGAVNVNTVSVLYFDSSTNVSGGSTAAEQAVFTANATGINNFVGGGGGLFSHAGAYGWLSALIPGLAPVNYETTGLSLTPSGAAAFPGLNNGDLSAGPWHQYFTGIGSIPVLATGVGPAGAAVPVILGGSGGSITNPDPVPGVPEPATWATMILGFGVVGASVRRRKRHVTYA